MKYVVTILMLVFLVACSSEPTVTQSEFDATVATLESEIEKLSPRHTDDNIRFIAETEHTNIRLIELKEELQTKQQTISALSDNLNQKQDEITALRANVTLLYEEIANLKELARVKEYPVTVEEGFRDIFDKATKVDRFTASDVISCAAESSFEARAGDVITVEVAFARNEVNEAHRVDDESPKLYLIYPNVQGFKEKRNFDINNIDWWSNTTEDRPHENLWMKNRDDRPFIVDVYRASITLDTVSTEYVDDTRTPGEGEYKVIFKEPDFECYKAVAPWRLDDIIPNSILVAWYVENESSSREKQAEVPVHILQYTMDVERYSKAIEFDPNDTEAYYQRGVAYVSLEQYEKAIDDFNELIRLTPDNTMGYYLRGLIYMRLTAISGAREDADKAMEDFNRIIQLDPNDAEAYYLRGSIHLVIGNTSQGAADQATAISLGFEP